MLLRLSMPRSPMRFLSCAILALTYVWRSLANLYSAFSERSPCARATAISLGSSTLSSWESWSISSWSFLLIFASGSDMVICLPRTPSPAADCTLEKDGGVGTARIVPPDSAQTNIIDAKRGRHKGRRRSEKSKQPPMPRSWKHHTEGTHRASASKEQPGGQEHCHRKGHARYRKSSIERCGAQEYHNRTREGPPSRSIFLSLTRGGL